MGLLDHIEIDKDFKEWQTKEEEAWLEDEARFGRMLKKVSEHRYYFDYVGPRQVQYKIDLLDWTNAIEKKQIARYKREQKQLHWDLVAYNGGITYWRNDSGIILEKHYYDTGGYIKEKSITLLKWFIISLVLLAGIVFLIGWPFITGIDADSYFARFFIHFRDIKLFLLLVALGLGLFGFTIYSFAKFFIFLIMTIKARRQRKTGM